MLPCAPGARVRMRVERGTVSEVRLTVGPRPTSAVATGERMTDLGEVPSAEAASYFLGLAGAGSGQASHDAITAAVVADSASVWQRLFAIATDSARVSRSTRRTRCSGSADSPPRR